jgi:hypothetical protein
VPGVWISRLGGCARDTAEPRVPLLGVSQSIRGVGRARGSIIEWSFFDELSLAEIGRRLGVKTSRACQIRTEALERLRDVLAFIEEAA